MEGKGEIEAVPIFLRRMVDEMTGYRVSVVVKCVPLDRSKLDQPDELQKAVQNAAERFSECPILVLHDADDDCPARLAESVRTRARAARSDRPISVVLANREFEGWFIAAAKSLQVAGYLHDQADLSYAEHPEAVRGAKEWIAKRLIKKTYKETVDQAKLSAQFDLQEARRNSPSFRKLWRDVERLLGNWDEN